MAMNPLGSDDDPFRSTRRLGTRGHYTGRERTFKSGYDASDALESLGKSKHFRINQVKTLQSVITYLDDASRAAENDPAADPSLPLRLATMSTFAPLIAHIGRLKAHCDDERFMEAYQAMYMAPIPERLQEIGMDLVSRYNDADTMGDRAAQRDYTKFAHELTAQLLSFRYGNPKQLCLPHNFSRLHPGIAAHSLQFSDQPSVYLKIDGPEPRTPHDPAVVDSKRDLHNTPDAVLWDGIFPDDAPFPTLLTLLDNDGPDKSIKDIVLTEIAYTLKQKIFRNNR